MPPPTPLPSSDPRCDAVFRRDRRADGRFVHAVTTTGVYCRPSCAARRPKPEHLRFSDTPQAAERAGFRACRRCRPREADADRVLVERACRAIAEAGTVPPLATLARGLGTTPERLLGAFRRILGTTPKRWTAALRRRRLRDLLAGGMDVTSAMDEAGFSGPARLHAAAAAGLGMAPSRYRAGGDGVGIRFALAPTPPGWLLLAVTAKGVCALAFGDDPESLERDLRRRFPRARRVEADPGLEGMVHRVLAHPEDPHLAPDLPRDVAATAFEARVWELLRRIPPGETASYGDIAARLGRPGAARAVARACAANPTALLVPCHRVVRADGTPGGWRWGEARKRALLERERRVRA